MEDKPVGVTRTDKKSEGNSNSVNDLLRQALIMLEQHNEQEYASTSGIPYLLPTAIMSNQLVCCSR